MRITYLVLVLTTECNLRCRYCYRGDGFHAPGEVMGDGVLEKALNMAAASGERFHVQLTGGEPALVPDRIRRVAGIIRERKWPATLGIQTNGTMIDRPLAKLFHGHGIQVGISLDGPVRIQERVRGKAAATLRGMELLDAAGVDFRVTAVVNGENVGHLDELALVLGSYKHARGMALDLLVQKGRAENKRPLIDKEFAYRRETFEASRGETEGAVYPASPKELEAGIEKLVKMLAMINRLRKVPIRLREKDLLQRKMDGNGKDSGGYCNAARGESLAVHPDGSLYTCGQTMGDPHFSCGTVDAPEPSGLKGLCGIKPENTTCRGCIVEGICPGECPSRIHYNGGKEALACTVYRTLFRLNPMNKKQ